MKIPSQHILTIGLLILMEMKLGAAELRVPDRFSTIQEAVSAASDGDIIRIASGIYTEQVFINRSGSDLSRNAHLTLIGEPGTILRAFQGMEQLGSKSNLDAPIVFVFNTNLHIQGITFEGERLAAFTAPGDYWLTGLQYNNSGGSVEKCHFHGFRNDGVETSKAITFFNEQSGAVPVDVRISDNTFVDVDFGIWLKGVAGRKTIDFTIEDNQITGAGPVPGVDGGSTGIDIRGGAGGVVRRNTISGFSWFDAPTDTEFPVSFGLLIFDGLGDDAHVLSSILVEDNLFRDNQNHFNMANGDNAIIRNNTFEGTAPGVDPGALNISGKDILIESNRFSGMENGITLWGQHPTFGKVLGVAENVILKNNWFSDVDEPVVRQRDSSDVESGSLLAPFPDPNLNISRAVRISWAGYADDYLLESAPSPDGPWSMTEEHPVRKGDNLIVFVSTGLENRFFRLRKP